MRKVSLAVSNAAENGPDRSVRHPDNAQTDRKDNLNTFHKMLKHQFQHYRPIYGNSCAIKFASSCDNFQPKSRDWITCFNQAHSIRLPFKPFRRVRKANDDYYRPGHVRGSTWYDFHRMDFGEIS